jgi:hypothetical protein
MARELLAIRLRVSESQFGVIRFADFDNVRLEWKRRRPASTRPRAVSISTPRPGGRRGGYAPGTS